MSDTSTPKSGPSALILWQAPGAIAAAATAYLEDAPKARDMAVPVRVGDIAAGLPALAKDPGARLVLVCRRPTADLAEALGEGAPPQAALAGWLDRTGDILKHLRRNRRRMVVVFAETLADDPALFADALGLAQPAPPPPGTPSPDPVLDLLAHEMLRRDAAARAMAGELEASALAPTGGDAPALPSLDKVFAQARAHLETEAALAQERTATAQAGAETALLRDQLALMTADLDAQRQLTAAQAASLHDAQAQATALAQDLAAGQSALTEHARSAADMATEQDLLRDQVRLLSAELASQMEARLAAEKTAATERTRSTQIAREKDSQRATLERDLATIRAQLAEAESRSRTLDEELAKAAQADVLQQDLARRLKAQIAELGNGLESSQLRIDQLEADRQTHLAQIERLHALREELEGYYDSARNLTEESESMTRRLAETQGALVRQTAALAERDAQVAGLQAELLRIRASRSYRITSPLRKVRSGLGPKV